MAYISAWEGVKRTKEGTAIWYAKVLHGLEIRTIAAACKKASFSGRERKSIHA